MKNVSYPKGFSARGTACGIKKSGQPDLGVLASEPPATAFGAFTRNAAAAAPVRYCREALAAGQAVSHVLVNSGNANAATGPKGYEDALESVARVRKVFGSEGAVLVCSTGVIGEVLPMESLRKGIDALSHDTKLAADFSTAIMTTDTFPKTAEVSLKFADGEVRIGGAAKGAGMICPNMATMLAFITTDIGLDSDYRPAFLGAVDRSFNSITVDGDMSTNDTALLLANGASGIRYAALPPAERRNFDAALGDLMRKLAQAVVRDGEGATKFISVEVGGADSESDAKAVARAVSNSPLVKTAFFGGDANWGRVLAAAGSSGASLDMAKLSLEFCGVRVFEHGKPLPRDEADMARRMQEKDVSVSLDLGLGKAGWTYWTCDLSYDYVKINGSYRS